MLKCSLNYLIEEVCEKQIRYCDVHTHVARKFECYLLKEKCVLLKFMLLL